MKRTFCKLMLALMAGLALAGCAELDMEGRGRVVLPPVVGPGTVYEPRHADDRDDEGYKKHKHKHKKDKDEGDDDDDDDDDDERHHGKHHKD